MDTTQRLSQLNFETCSRLTARKCQSALWNKPPKGEHGVGRPYCPFPLHPQGKAMYAEDFDG